MIEGTCDARFAGLRDAFASNFAPGLDIGAAVAVYANGKLVADLWGGHADAARKKPWTGDTLVNVWSSTKGVMALAVAMLVERGKLTYHRPIAEVWPEFAANGKETIPLDLALSHQAGLNGLSVPMSFEQVYQWTPYVDALAAMAPLWTPGSRFVYHALTYGHLAGEPLRRVYGDGVGAYIAREIAGPLDTPFYVGLPESLHARVAELIEGPQASDWLTDVRASPYPQSADNPAPVAVLPNQRAWRAAEIPGGNGHGTARSLAAIYGAMVDGSDRLLGKAALAEAIRLRFDGVDAISGDPTCFAAGFCLKDATYGNRASKRTFGHGGWGGAMAFADPDAGIGFAYVMNHMLGFDGVDPRRKVLVDAVYDALGA